MKQLCINAIIILLLSGCGDYIDNRLIVNNTSETPIAVEFSNDTIIVEKSKVEYYIATALQPKETRQFSQQGSSEAWSYYIESGIYKKLSIYFYDIDTLKKYDDIDYINRNKLFSKKVVYSENELNKIKWVINYP